jgi:GNAT superfamily N-acetyltransferase
MLTIGHVAEAELEQVRAFYEANGYGGGASKDDLVLAARVDGRLAGVVRLCPENGVIVLRGMQVASGFQRQGIGRALLAYCVPHMARGEAWCLPYDHLVDFYERAGFTAVPPGELPPFLAERLAGYLAQGQRVLAMRRPPVV